MIIVVNGKPVEINEGTTVGALLESRNLNAERVVIEFNRTILIRSEFDSRIIPEGAELEILSFVGGGFHA